MAGLDADDGGECFAPFPTRLSNLKFNITDKNLKKSKIVIFDFLPHFFDLFGKISRSISEISI